MYTAARSDSLELKGMLNSVPDQNWDQTIGEKNEFIKEQVESQSEVEKTLSEQRKILSEIRITLATYSKQDLITPEELEEFEKKISDATDNHKKSTKAIENLEKDIESIDRKLSVIEQIKNQFPITDITESLKEQQAIAGQIIGAESQLNKQ